MNRNANDEQSVSERLQRSTPTARGGRYSRPVGPPRPGLSDEQWQALGRKLRLCGRQLEIVRGMLDGLAEEAIGRKLGIGRATVHTYIGRIYRKLDVHCRCGLAVHVMHTCLSLSLTSGPGPSPAGLAPPAGPGPDP